MFVKDQKQHYKSSSKVINMTHALFSKPFEVM